MWATFKGKGHTQQPPEVQKNKRSHQENERQEKLRNLIEGNVATIVSNTKRKLREAGDDVRATFEHLRHTRNTQEHGEQSLWVERDK